MSLTCDRRKCRAGASLRTIFSAATRRALSADTFSACLACGVGSVAMFTPSLHSAAEAVVTTLPSMESVHFPGPRFFTLRYSRFRSSWNEVFAATDFASFATGIGRDFSRTSNETRRLETDTEDTAAFSLAVHFPEAASIVTSETHEGAPHDLRMACAMKNPPWASGCTRSDPHNVVNDGSSPRSRALYSDIGACNSQIQSPRADAWRRTISEHFSSASALPGRVGLSSLANSSYGVGVNQQIFALGKPRTSASDSLGSVSRKSSSAALRFSTWRGVGFVTYPPFLFESFMPNITVTTSGLHENTSSSRRSMLSFALSPPTPALKNEYRRLGKRV